MVVVLVALALALVAGVPSLLAYRRATRPRPPVYRFHDPELARMAAAGRGATMLAKGEIADALDHPIFFLIVLSIGVVCMLAILSWGAKAANLPGISALLQHP